MAVFDASFLIYLFDEDANPPNDPATGQPVTHFKARIEYLVRNLEHSGDKVIIPTPALSEYLVGAKEAGLEPYGLHELALPPDDAQQKLDLEPRPDEADDGG